MDGSWNSQPELMHHITLNSFQLHAHPVCGCQSKCFPPRTFIHSAVSFRMLLRASHPHARQWPLFPKFIFVSVIHLPLYLWLQYAVFYFAILYHFGLLVVSCVFENFGGSRSFYLAFKTPNSSMIVLQYMINNYFITLFVIELLSAMAKCIGGIFNLYHNTFYSVLSTQPYCNHYLLVILIVYSVNCITYWCVTLSPCHHLQIRHYPIN